MNSRKLIAIAGWIFGFFGIGAIIGLVVLSHQNGAPEFSLVSPHKSQISAAPTPTPASGAAAAVPDRQTAPANVSQANILEIPRASLDFVGNWGGYTSGTVRDVVSNMRIKAPRNQTSVTFGHVKDTVFISLELYSAPDIEFAVKPKAWIVDPKEAVVESEYQNYQYHFVDTATYQLAGSGRIVYKDDTKVYDRSDRRLAIVIKEHARLKRLSPEEADLFAKAPSGSVPKADVSARKDFNDDASTP